MLCLMKAIKVENLLINYICNKYLSKEVSKKIDLKFSPKLVFRYDESFEKVNAIEELLNSDKFTKDLRD